MLIIFYFIFRWKPRNRLADYIVSRTILFILISGRFNRNLGRWWV